MKTIKMLWPFGLLALVIAASLLTGCVSEKKVYSAREQKCPSFGDYGYAYGSK